MYSRFDVNYQNDWGLCTDFVRKFLEFGQDPNLVVETTGDSPLHFAARGLNASAVESLLRRGADPNLANKDGSTPLHIMGEKHGSAEIIETLFKISAEKHRRFRVDARDSLGNTPLHFAVQHMRDFGGTKVVEMPLRIGGQSEYR
ncbi:hypothetical protein TKK_0004116 [Trichogramma kaykai]